MKYFYALLSVAGLILPYTSFLPYVMENGLDLPLLLNEAFGSRISSFAWLDVLVSAVVLLGFMIAEGRRSGVKYLPIPVLGTLLVGVSFGFPLFLFLREIRLNKG